ncbi:hypothetical protein NLX86_30465 [Streptomyces sp. A3M-1-3]|uniref:hypothetical protein n=1 Tax=Streptomyces sp. A3M-1-3 TaxID=2962044 RepID=UPI0020B77186|nr:hypothetical protein [Streptomyces sp. A3M-1-3]MCP3822255.1 hypothetical protein [Streptomyces sp. A3M-1-3]
MTSRPSLRDSVSAGSRAAVPPGLVPALPWATAEELVRSPVTPQIWRGRTPGTTYFVYLLTAPGPAGP